MDLFETAESPHPALESWPDLFAPDGFERLEPEDAPEHGRRRAPGTRSGKESRTSQDDALGTSDDPDSLDPDLDGFGLVIPVLPEDWLDAFSASERNPSGDDVSEEVTVIGTTTTTATAGMGFTDIAAAVAALALDALEGVVIIAGIFGSLPPVPDEGDDATSQSSFPTTAGPHDTGLLDPGAPNRPPGYEEPGEQADDEAACPEYADGEGEGADCDEACAKAISRAKGQAESFGCAGIEEQSCDLACTDV